MLFGDSICARINEELLTNFNLHTIVRLPNGVFAPYTSIPTNLLFFDHSGPTKEIWYYEQPLPEGRKQYTKTQPLQYEEFAPCLAWWRDRQESERAWKIDFKVLYEEAKAKAAPHWEAAERAEEMARQYAREDKELANQAQPLQRMFTGLAPQSKESVRLRDKIQELTERRFQTQANERHQCELAREE